MNRTTIELKLLLFFETFRFIRGFGGMMISVRRELSSAFIPQGSQPLAGG